MSEDKVYKDGDIVWVKLGNNWWPGEVTGPSRHPEGLIKHLKRVPYCVVKFFNENTYEYVRSSKQIFPFQCAKQEEFIRKGYSLYNSGNSFMEKFPNDVEVAKQLTHRKETSLIINDRPDSIVKAILGQPLIRTCDDYYDGSEYQEKRRSADSITKILNITKNRNEELLNNEKCGTQTSSTLNIPYNKTKNDADTVVNINKSNSNSNYQCNLCDFTSMRQNVMILHRKMHSNRNSLGASNINSTTTDAKSSPAAIDAARATNFNNKQNQIGNRDKTIITTKVCTTIARTTKTPTPVKETKAELTSTHATSNVNDALKRVTCIAKTNKITKSQTLTRNEEKTNTSLKSSKKLAEREKKEDSAYATILSDFCPSETETSPTTELKQSRRSLRHCKNPIENTSGQAATICIDLSETKTIQKIPKKREYNTLQQQKECTAEVVVLESNLCFGEKGKETTAATVPSNVCFTKPKKNADDIRKMLLADWSDDDENPNDAIVVEDNTLEDNTESNECIAETIIGQNSSDATSITSTPVVKPAAAVSVASTGRIRNIPKKDRRDVVLQDFNSDLSLIQNEKSIIESTKPMTVDLDSSNSSVVEIIEDEQTAGIITINDDEEQEISKSHQNPSEIVINTKENDSAVDEMNNKSTSAATSTTSLSCFDFQDEEDERETTTSIISHFKKKYLCGEKLQNLASLSSTSNMDELKDDVVVRNRAELAEKDQLLEAEIETLLEQTQPPVADLLNANSFEESLSVKDLPIKERGKRIFKSRNKTRLEQQSNANNTLTAVDSLTPNLYKSVEKPLSVLEIINNDIKDKEEPDHMQANSEVTTDRKVETTTEHENLKNKQNAIDTSCQEVLCNTQAEKPKHLENNELPTNENKENEDISGGNKEPLDISNVEQNSTEVLKELKEKELEIEVIEEEIIVEQEENQDRSYEHCSTQKLNKQDSITEQNGATELQPEQETIIEEEHEMCKNVEAIQEVELSEKYGKVTETCSPKLCEFVIESENCKISNITENKNIALETQNLEDVQDNLDNILVNESTTKREISNIPKSNEEILIDIASVKEFQTPAIETNNEVDTNVKQQDTEENSFKIRLKSQNQGFVATFPQQEHELQATLDTSVEARVMTITPTDENSSMGASDTGAEFGSPTSMLSEERLPTFRFQGNQTPQQELEVVAAELQIINAEETVRKEIRDYTAKNDHNETIRAVNLLDDLKETSGNFGQKSLQHRRFSMDLKSLQTNIKSIKRHRLSVDGTDFTNQQKSLENNEEIFKGEGKIRHKSRHLKITPRRNVSDLFKASLTQNHNTSKDIEKSNLLESRIESEDNKKVLNVIENTLENHKKDIQEHTQNNDNSNVFSNTIFEETPNSKYSHSSKNAELSENNKIEQSDTITIRQNSSDVFNDKEEKQENNQENTIVIPEEDRTNKAIELTEESDVKTNTTLEMEDESETTAQVENVTAIADSPTNINKIDAAFINRDENIKNEIKSTTSNQKEYETTTIESCHINDYKYVEPITNNTSTKTLQTEPVKTTIITADAGDMKNSADVSFSVNKTKTETDNEFEKSCSFEMTPQEPEMVIENEHLSKPSCTQQNTKDIESQSKEKDNSTDLGTQLLISQENETHIGKKTDPTNQTKLPQETNNSLLTEAIKSPLAPKEEKTNFNKAVAPLITPKETESQKEETEINVNPVTLQEIQPINESTTAAQLLTPQQCQYMAVELKNNVPMACTSHNNIREEKSDSPMQTPHTNDLIVECEPLTPHSIIECVHNLPAQVTPEKEVVVESDINLAPCVIPDKDLIIEEKIQLEGKEALLEGEFPVLQTKAIAVTTDAAQETETSALQTDADKAAEEFLIEFDNIVNHSHLVEEDVPNSAVDDTIYTEDHINNIIEEVHEDHQLKEDIPAKSKSPLQYEPVTRFTVVAPRNSWNQIFKESFNRQLQPVKRRQTICFEISDTKEGVACKKQALDFENILPASKTVKRTAERKLTLPAIETKLSNSHQQQHNIITLNHTQMALNKKIITTNKRKLSIEDNITSFIIERPKQSPQPTSVPPPLQRIRSLSRQSQCYSKAGIDNLLEPPPLHSSDSLLQDLFQSESSSPTHGMDIAQKDEGGRVIQQQIIHASPISQNFAPSESKISKNKQIGVDSRGNKYVIIKTPPTDIIVQPTLTSSTAAAATTANNFGTIITVQPLARSSSDSSVTKAATTTPPRKQNTQQHQMKHISVAVKANSPLEISKVPEVAAKSQHRHRRKVMQSKAVTAAATTNCDVNSAKHRQAMEALSRRLSIAAEAPPLAKISKTSSTNVQTQISTNSNLTTFFTDTQISSIAQQQFMQLQQQQQPSQQETQITLTPSLPPPIILNKNAHQQSVIQRKSRKILQQQKQRNLHQQQQNAANAAKSSQLIQQLQQQNQLQQQQEIQQQQFITQLTSQQPQQNNALQLPPLQQIQPQTLPVVQQQIVQQSDGIIITTAATEDDNVIDSNTQLIALPTQPYPGYSETFLLCKVKGNTCKPVDNVPLYLNHQLNELVPVPLEALEGGHKSQEHQIEIKAANASQQLLEGQNNAEQENDASLQMTNLNCHLGEQEISAGIESDQQHLHQHHHNQQQVMEEGVVEENGESAGNNQLTDFEGNQDVNSELVSNNGILLNIEGQQVLLDAATFAHLLANPDANTQLISDDGTEYVLTHEVLAALQMQQEQQQALELANAAAAEQQQQQHIDSTGGSDIIAVALAGSELYDNDVLTIDTSQGMQLIDGDGSIVFPTHTGAITQQHLTPPAVVTNAVLDQSPIMSTLEVPSSIAAHKLQGTQLITVPSHHLTTSANAALGGRLNLEDSLAAIGVTTQSSNIPSSLGLPITVTNPNIASKVTSAGPLNEILQFVSHRPATAAATAAAVAAAALAGETRIFTD